MYNALLSYGFLFLAVLLLWMPGSRTYCLWGLALFASIILGLLSHQLETTAIVPIILLALAIYYSGAEQVSIFVRVIAGIFTIILSIGLAAHQLPGFHSLNMLDHVFISSDALPFSLDLPFDKTVVGIFLLGLSHQLISNKRGWLEVMESVAWQAPIVIVAVIILALILGFIKFDFKIPNSIFIWAMANLLFICMAEEAFFRGFIQKNLSLMMKKVKWGDYWALIIAAILFGLAHYGGGTKYVILATTAGAGYGWVYIMTKRIEGSILTHFGLNLTHFLFFTYPALANGVLAKAS